MLRVGVIFLLLIATSISYPYYNPWCRSGCVRQPQCSTGVTPCAQFSQCCNGFNGYYGGYSGYGGITYPAVPVGYPGVFTHGQPSFVAPINPYNPYNPYNPGPQGNGEPLKIVVGPMVTEWRCPVDPEPRAALLSGPIECTADENCVSTPIRQKCCFDSGIGSKVCKEAIPA